MNTEDHTVPGWTVLADHQSPFVRTYVAHPDAPIDVEYWTPTTIKGRHTDASFVGRVIGVRVRYQWDHEKAAWWGSGSLRIHLVNPRTGQRYKTGWKSEEVPVSWVEEGVSNARAIVDPVVAALHPRTFITVLEVADEVA